MVVQLTRRVRLFASCTGGGHPSSENDRLPPSLTPLLLLYSRYVYADMYVYARIYVSSFLLPAVVAGLPLASAPLPSRALERALPPLVVRVPWLLFLPEFFLLSTVRVPDYSRLRLPCSRQTARATLNCFEIEGTVIVHIHHDTIAPYILISSFIVVVYKYI